MTALGHKPERNHVTERMYVPPRRGVISVVFRASVVLALILSLLGLTALVMPARNDRQCAITISNPSVSGIPSMFLGACVSLERVTTPAAQEKGLSGRADIAPDQGMLFVFGEPASRCIWMKDMRFAIDVVWLDADKRVIQMYERLEPATYPSSFCSDKPAQYVIELAPGLIMASGIRVGSYIDL